MKERGEERGGKGGARVIARSSFSLSLAHFLFILARSDFGFF